MILLGIVVSLLTCTTGTVLRKDLQVNTRVVGGDTSNIYDVPYTVALLLDREITGAYIQACVGSLIGEQVLLTAAHCTNGTYDWQWMIRAGTVYHNALGQLIDIHSYVQHPDFNDNYDNDISLIFLPEKLIMGASVAVVPVPLQKEDVLEGSIAVLTGWGYLYEDGSHITHLYSAYLPIVNHDQCVEAYASVNPVTENMICAGNFEAGGVGPCDKDDGGPLVVDDVLVGITSWSLGCARPKYPGVWTKVSMYRDWIDENVELFKTFVLNSLF